MFSVFRRRCYKVWHEGPAVFVRGLRPMDKWDKSALNRYSEDVWGHVKAGLSEEAYTLASMPNMQAHPEVWRYVEDVRQALISEYALDAEADAVTIDRYQLGMLVLSFTGKAGVEYPLYYRGIKLRARIR